MNAKISMEMNDMRQNKIHTMSQLQLLTLKSPDWLTIGHLYIRYFLEKIIDMKYDAEKNIYSETDIMCFTETYLTKHHDIKEFLKTHNFVAFRQDIPNQQHHGGKH